MLSRSRVQLLTVAFNCKQFFQWCTSSAFYPVATWPIFPRPKKKKSHHFYSLSFKTWEPVSKFGKHTLLPRCCNSLFPVPSILCSWKDLPYFLLISEKPSKISASLNYFPPLWNIVAARPFSTCGDQNKSTYRMECLKASLTLFQPWWHSCLLYYQFGVGNSTKRNCQM